jgi:hypothetical protein
MIQIILGLIFRNENVCFQMYLYYEKFAFSLQIHFDNFSVENGSRLGVAKAISSPFGIFYPRVCSRSEQLFYFPD